MMTTRVIIPAPLPSLACFASTDEGIYDGVTFTNVVLARLLVLPARGKRRDGKLCERDQTTCLGADGRQNKEGNSLP